MPGDKCCREFFSVLISASRDDGHWFDAGDVETVQLVEHVVLANCESLCGLFDRDNVVAQVNETDDVTRNTFGQCRDSVLWPILE